VNRCEKCRQPLTVGEWPFCPHGFPMAGLSIIDDQLEGGPRRFETMGADAPFISSKSEWRREAAARGLIQVDKHDRAYYNAKFRQHDEQIKDTGKYSDHGL
jgi:hypothetical protein